MGYHCPLLPGLQVSWGPLEFRRCGPVRREVRKDEGEGNGVGCSPEGWSTHRRSFVFIFYLSLAGRNRREGLWERFQQNIHQFSRCVLSGCGLHWWVSVRAQGRWSLQRALASPILFAPFLVLELKYNWGLDVISREVTFCIWLSIAQPVCSAVCFSFLVPFVLAYWPVSQQGEDLEEKTLFKGQIFMFLFPLT